MNTNKILQAAIAAKSDGYEYMTSIIKSVYNTNYNHVVPIDRVISCGRWPGCMRGQHQSADGQSTWYGPCGVTDANLPPKSINKTDAIFKYCRGQP